MDNILREIVENKRREVADRRARHAEEDVRKAAREAVARTPRRSLADSLSRSATGIIAEFKRRSPSLGWICPEATVDDVVPAYTAAGAAALSVLADRTYFGGGLDFVRRARQVTTLPVLCKEFIIDSYQIYEAAEYGADAVLLIAACLTRDECRHFAAEARRLGLDVLLELHNEEELPYVTDDVTVVGVNNRDLRTFHTDVATSLRMATSLPSDKVRISESGLREASDIQRLREAGYRGFLMGERFMSADDPGAALSRLIRQLS